MRPAFDNIPVFIEVIHIIPLHEYVELGKNPPPRILGQSLREVRAHDSEYSLFVHRLLFVVCHKNS